MCTSFSIKRYISEFKAIISFERNEFSLPGGFKAIRRKHVHYLGGSFDEMRMAYYTYSIVV